LAGILLGLTILSTFDQFAHLRGTVPMSRGCPVCAWARAMLTGAKAGVVLTWLLVLLGLSFEERPHPVPAAPCRTTPSRAPPAPTRYA
jgi:hypothetical protein